MSRQFAAYAVVALLARDRQGFLEGRDGIREAAAEVLVLPEAEERPAALLRARAGAGAGKCLLEHLMSQREEPAIDPVHPQVGRKFESQRRTSTSAIAPGVRRQQIRQLAVETPVPAVRLAGEELRVRVFRERDEVGKMSLAHGNSFAGFAQSILCILPHSLQHAIARLVCIGAVDQHERLIDQPAESLQRRDLVLLVAHDRRRGLQRPSADEDGKTAQPLLLVRRHVLVAPLQRCEQRLVARHRA